VATKVDLDPALVDEAVAVGGRRTKKEAVTEALREYIAAGGTRRYSTYSAASNTTQSTTTRNSGVADKDAGRAIRVIAGAAPANALEDPLTEFVRVHAFVAQSFRLSSMP